MPKDKKLLENLELIDKNLTALSVFLHGSVQLNKKDTPLPIISPYDGISKYIIYDDGFEKEYDNKINEIKKCIKFLNRNGVSLPPLFENTEIKTFKDIALLVNEKRDIKGNSSKDILNEYFKEITNVVNRNIFKLKHNIPVKDTAKDKKESPYRLPIGTTWENITIKFKDEFEVEIFMKGKFFKKASHEDLGFLKSNKSKKPDRGWNFLLLLSVIQEHKEMEATQKNMADSLTRKLGKIISINNCEKIKSDMSRKLQEVFSVEGEPFEDYKEYGYYKTKFILKPLPNLRGEGSPFITKRNEFKEGFDYGKGSEPNEDGYMSL